MTSSDLSDEAAEVDYDGVVAALEEFVGDWVQVHIDDGVTLMGTVATVAGVLGPGSLQDTLEGGVEGIRFLVGEVPRSYYRGPSDFAVWRKPLEKGLREKDRVVYRMGSIVVVVDRVPGVSDR